MHKLSERYKQKGFTIVEVLVVIMVIGILASLVVVAYIGAQQRAQDAERSSDMRAIESAIRLYAANDSKLGIYPWTSGFMNTQGNAMGFMGEYVDDPSIFHAPGRNEYSVVNHYNSGAGVTSIEQMQAQIQPNEYHYIPLHNGSMCLWAQRFECDGFILNWLDSSGEMHEIRG